VALRRERRQVRKLDAPGVEEGIGADKERVGTLARKHCERRTPLWELLSPRRNTCRVSNSLSGFVPDLQAFHPLRPHDARAYRSLRHYTKSRSPARTRSRRRRVALAPKGSNINTQTRRAGGPGNNGARASDNAGSNRPYHHKRAVCTPWSDKLDVPPELIRTSKTLNKSPSACSTAPLRGDPIAMR
jgi:hypothetical protein